MEQELVDYTKTVTTALVGFQYEDLYRSEAPVGTCPNCGNKVFEEVRGYLCERNTGVGTECDFIIWKERMGRYIDRQLAIDLLAAENRTVGPVDYFVDRSGRSFLQGTVQVTKKYSESKDTDVWQLDVDLGGSRENGEAEELLGETPMACPWEHEGVDQCVIMETTQRWVCRELLEGRAKKGPQLPKNVCKRDMEASEAIPYFSDEGETPFLDDFISRWDKPFRAKLVRRPRSGRYKFEFPPREGKKDSTKKTDGDAKAKTTRRSASTKKKASTKKRAATKRTRKAADNGESAPAPAPAPPRRPGSARARAAARRAKTSESSSPTPPAGTGSGT